MYNGFRSINDGKDIGMNTKRNVFRKAFVDKTFCVACGCCVKVCPREAIAIKGGITAAVDESSCVGCGKCAKECPASVIEIREVGA